MAEEYGNGYYWAYRKGSPVPDIVYYHEGVVYEIVVCKIDVSKYFPNHGLEESIEFLDLEGEDLSEQKWVLGKKVTYEELTYI